jgi:hypothetical protein
LFWATDINCGLSDYASVCLFFDILMEGRLDPQTGDYSIEVVKDPEDFADREFEVKGSQSQGNNAGSSGAGGVGSSG